jgi:hypothetical protein
MLVAVLGSLVFTGLVVATMSSMIAMSGAVLGVCAVVLVQLFGFAPVVTFAGNEGDSGQSEQRENFHRGFP